MKNESRIKLMKILEEGCYILFGLENKVIYRSCRYCDGINHHDVSSLIEHGYYDHRKSPETIGHKDDCIVITLTAELAEEIEAEVRMNAPLKRTTIPVICPSCNHPEDVSHIDHTKEVKWCNSCGRGYCLTDSGACFADKKK